MTAMEEGVPSTAPHSFKHDAVIETPASHKITHYFPVIKKGETNLIFHCYNNCKLGRKHESVGAMIGCDGCGLWFHNKCVDEKTNDRPKKKVSLWFCVDCKSCFKEYKCMKKELNDLKTMVKSFIKRSTTPKTSSDDLQKTSTRPRPPRPTGLTDSKSQKSELETLREENKELKSRLENTNSLLDMV